MKIKLITSTIEKAKIQGDTLDFVSAICISFSVKKLLYSFIHLYYMYKVQR